MLSFGGQLLGIDLLNQVRDRGEDFILGSVAGTVTLGYWSVAGRLVQVIRETGTTVVMQVATPAFSKLQRDRERLARALETSLYTSSAVIFPAMAVLAVLSPDLIPMILGEQWAATAGAAQVIAITTALATLSWFDRTIFIAIERLRPELAMVSVFAALHVIIVFVFVQQPLVILALALLIKGIVIFPIRATILHRAAGIPYWVYGKSARVGLAALLYVLVGEVAMIVLDDSSAVVRVAVGVALALVVYPLALWFTARSVLKSMIADVRGLRRTEESTSLDTVPLPRPTGNLVGEREFLVGEVAREK
jgi:O-antigen/teichoic acid export membrane protein